MICPHCEKWYDGQGYKRHPNECEDNPDVDPRDKKLIIPYIIGITVLIGLSFTVPFLAVALAVTWLLIGKD